VEIVSAGIRKAVGDSLKQGRAQDLFTHVEGNLAKWPASGLRDFCDQVVAAADNGKAKATGIEALTLLYDRRYDMGDKRRATVLPVLEETLMRLFDATPIVGEPGEGSFRRFNWDSRAKIVGPQAGQDVLVIDAEKFPPEGDDCDAVYLRKAYQAGWRRFIVYRMRGQRFTGVGLGPNTEGVRIDTYGSSGDYLASGMDGEEIYIHGNAQDQVGQIAKRGKLVIYGDVGTTFMYGAKGADVFIMGNAAGRPLINAVGRPRVVINGTCLDFLAESFMAGDPLNGGGFVILNGVEFDNHAKLVPLASPYPGSNLFSLASGGAIYVRDPGKKVVEQQLNGGVFAPFTNADWRLIRAYLEENERLFGVKVQDLLTVNGKLCEPEQVYRKVSAQALAVLAAATEKKK
jgi:glutamate synthase domain-containing protein 3